MYRGSYLESKSQEVLRAEKWAKWIRKAACILAILIMLIMFIDIFSTAVENNNLTQKYLDAGIPLETIREEIPEASETVIEGIIVTAIAVGAILAVGFFAAMLLDLRAADVHNKAIIANCALYNVYNDGDEETDE